MCPSRVSTAAALPRALPSTFGCKRAHSWERDVPTNSLYLPSNTRDLISVRTRHRSMLGDLGGRLGEVANVVIPRFMTTSTLPENDTVLMLADENLACGARIIADI
jgi:hypothetical protein